jgi:hypothetical protein
VHRMAGDGAGESEPRRQREQGSNASKASRPPQLELNSTTLGDLPQVGTPRAWKHHVIIDVRSIGHRPLAGMVHGVVVHATA